eukprot:2948898-Lingulodinium_polyedra.AAC.1
MCIRDRSKTYLKGCHFRVQGAACTVVGIADAQTAAASVPRVLRALLSASRTHLNSCRVRAQ